MNSFYKEKKALDKLWSKAILLRDKHCQICGSLATDPHHIS